MVDVFHWMKIENRNVFAMISMLIHLLFIVSNPIICHVKTLSIYRCFYGSFCDISTNVYSLSLDAILTFRILPNVPLNTQQSAILTSLSIAIINVILGFINEILSLLTFKNVSTHESGCSIYLFVFLFYFNFSLFFFYKHDS